MGHLKAFLLLLALLASSEAHVLSLLSNMFSQSISTRQISGGCQIGNVCFAIDDSSSLSDDEYAAERALVITAATQIDAELTGTMYSAVAYAQRIEEAMFADVTDVIQTLTADFSAFSAALAARARATGFRNDGHKVGLTACQTQLAGATGTRTIVLLTDGSDNNPPTGIDVAPGIKETTNIITIGIGDQVVATELQNIANSPDFSMTVGSFAELTNLVKPLLADLCAFGGAAPATPSSSPTPSVSPSPSGPIVGETPSVSPSPSGPIVEETPSVSPSPSDPMAGEGGGVGGPSLSPSPSSTQGLAPSTSTTVTATATVTASPSAFIATAAATASPAVGITTATATAMATATATPSAITGTTGASGGGDGGDGGDGGAGSGAGPAPSPAPSSTSTATATPSSTPAASTSVSPTPSLPVPTLVGAPVPSPSPTPSILLGRIGGSGETDGDFCALAYSLCPLTFGDSSGRPLVSGVPRFAVDPLRRFAATTMVLKDGSKPGFLGGRVPRTIVVLPDGGEVPLGRLRIRRSPFLARGRSPYVVGIRGRDRVVIQSFGGACVKLYFKFVVRVRVPPRGRFRFRGRRGRLVIKQRCIVFRIDGEGFYNFVRF